MTNPVPRRLRRAGLGLAVAAALLGGGAATAQAHVQMSPTVAAPGDGVKFTMLVPGERDQETTKVVLKVPADVLPFAFADPPGWTRRNVIAGNGAIDQIEWTGRLPADGFVEFSFLAGTPESTGQIAWKTLQTYSDGEVVRWIGAPDADEPAPTTDIVADAPRQNAGGEGEEAGGGGETPTATATATIEPTTTAATTGSAAPVQSSSSGGDDGLARVLGLIGLLAGLTALGLVLLRRPGGA